MTRTPLHIQSTRDALFTELRSQILSGELKPGTPLTESGLALLFEVARPTVRSALQELATRHLARQSGRSLAVPELDGQDVRDLYYVRAPLEVAAVQRIVAEGTDLGEARRRLAQMEALPPSSRWATLVEVHSDFHIAIVNAAGSARLSRIYSTLQDEMQLCLAQIHGAYRTPKELADEHRALLSALESGDMNGAVAEMEAHLQRAVANFVKAPDVVL